MSIYLRFKRKTQTIFLTCEPKDHIGKIKDQLSKIVGMASENVRLFPYLTEQQRIVLLGKQKEENRLAFEEALRRKKAARAAKLKNKKPGAGKKKEDDDDDDESFRAEMKFDPNPVLVILPLPENKTIDSLQLESGSTIFFVYKASETEDIWEDVDVPLLQPANEVTEADMQALQNKTGSPPPGTANTSTSSASLLDGTPN